MHFAIIKKNAPHTCYQEINKIKGKNSKDWDKKKRKKRDCQGRYEWVSDIYVAHSCVTVLKRSKESISTEVDQWMYSKFYPATGKKSESLMDKYLLCEKGSKCFFT